MKKIKWIVTLMLLFLFMANNSVMAVDYELNDINGNKQSLNQYEGKWVIAHYWATWCRTCLKELPLNSPFLKSGWA